MKNDLPILKKRIKKAGLTRERIASELGVSVGTVNNWLSGYRPMPARYRHLLDSMLENTPGASPLELVQAVAVRFTPAELDRLRKVAGIELASEVEDAIRDALEEKWGIISGKTPAPPMGSSPAPAEA